MSGKELKRQINLPAGRIMHANCNLPENKTSKKDIDIELPKGNICYVTLIPNQKTNIWTCPNSSNL